MARKVMLDPETVFEGDGYRTPWGAKEMRRRRRAKRAAKLARRKNRK